MKRIKILVIDDEEAEEIKENIEDFTFHGKGCEVETAVTIDDANKRINELRDKKKQFYDVIIIDMKMDDKEENGLELAEKIRKFSSIKIILTAYSSIQNCVKCLKVGAFDYIDKNAVSYEPYEKLKESMRKGLEERLQEPFDPFMKWLNKNLPEFIEIYSGEHIAVIDETVVEHDLNYDALMERVKKNYPFHIPTIATVPRKEDKECLYLQ